VRLKSVPRAAIQASIDRIDAEIERLKAKKEGFTELLGESSEDDSLPKKRAKREGSKFRRALAVLAQHKEGLTVSQLHEKANESEIGIEFGNLTSQLSKASKRIPAEVIRKEDGRYVVA
jgi:hypothetical protein